MRINGLFWNIDGGDRAEIVAQFAAERDLDIVVLCESAIDVGHLLDILAAKTGKTYAYPASALMRLQIFRRSHELGLEEIHGSANGRLTVRRLNCNGNQLLFAAAHLISKREWGEQSQQIEAQVLATELRDVEQRQGHRRTILVGDLNLNPFEEGIVGAGGLHAMMSKADVAVGSRIVQDTEYPFFYNPMWGLFGDRTPGPPGSHHYRAGEHISYDWNMFDQMLIRPDALKFISEHVELLTRTSDINLATKRGRPNRKVGSDHFPLFFSFQSSGKKQ